MSFVLGFLFGVGLVLAVLFGGLFQLRWFTGPLLQGSSLPRLIWTANPPLTEEDDSSAPGQST